MIIINFFIFACGFCIVVIFCFVVEIDVSISDFLFFKSVNELTNMNVIRS